MDRYKVIRRVVGALFGGAGAIGYAINITQVANIGFESWPVIALVICLGIVIWDNHKLGKEIEGLRDARPSIRLSADSINDMRYIKVTNDGEEGVFSAQLSVIRAPGSCVGEEYDGLWDRNNTNESRLMQGQSDYVRVAWVRATGSETFLELHGFDCYRKCQRTIGTVKCYEASRKGLPTSFQIQVSIFSKPSLRNGVVTRAYLVGLQGIHDYPVNTKLTTIPGKYIEM